jgi:hypothetical protein
MHRQQWVKLPKETNYEQVQGIYGTESDSFVVEASLPQLQQLG